MKDLGEDVYILGIKIYRGRSKRLIGLSQSTYIDKVLNRFSMQDSKRGFLPMSHSVQLSKTQCPSTTDERSIMSRVPYASAIGSIMYAMLCTRPDVSYALSVTSRYQANPDIQHWNATKNILKYLRKTKDIFLVYNNDSEFVVNSYTDASFWIKKFLSELGVVPSVLGPVDLYCDNNGATTQANEPRSHSKSKHVLRRYHLIREIVNKGDVKICRVDTISYTAHPLTNFLPQAMHQVQTPIMGL